MGGSDTTGRRHSGVRERRCPAADPGIGLMPLCASAPRSSESRSILLIWCR